MEPPFLNNYYQTEKKKERMLSLFCIYILIDIDFLFVTQISKNGNTSEMPFFL
jgi:hypothetical protein